MALTLVLDKFYRQVAKDPVKYPRIPASDKMKAFTEYMAVRLALSVRCPAGELNTFEGVHFPVYDHMVLKDLDLTNTQMSIAGGDLYSYCGVCLYSTTIFCGGLITTPSKPSSGSLIMWHHETRYLPNVWLPVNDDEEFFLTLEIDNSAGATMVEVGVGALMRFYKED